MVDWRKSVAREAEKILELLGYKLDWLAFADAWRGEYQPGMEEVRSGRQPFAKLDVLHRRNLERLLPRFGLQNLSDEVLDDLTLRRSEYEREGAEAIIAKIKARFGLPVYAKPASLGSSVGVSRCTDEAGLADALQLAFELDRIALVEPAIEGGKEINCAVLGRPGAELRVSACEQPIASAELLSFEDKYMRQGGKDGSAKSEGMSSADRIIPAPISDELTASVEELSRRTFEVLGCTGVARVDLLLDAQDRLFVNEPNTIPGSFAFYLWEHVGLSFADLLDELIDIAMAEHAEKHQTTRTFETNLLAMRGDGAKLRGEGAKA